MQKDGHLIRMWLQCFSICSKWGILIKRRSENHLKGKKCEINKLICLNKSEKSVYFFKIDKHPPTLFIRHLCISNDRSSIEPNTLICCNKRNVNVLFCLVPCHFSRLFENSLMTL